MPTSQIASRVADCSRIETSASGDWIVLCVLTVVAFLVRFANSAHRFLNADEALHYLLGVQPSLAAAYKASLTTVHPPLLIVFLHYWGKLGRSELLLRLPSIFAGLAFAWIMFGWLRRVTGRPTALIAFALLMFSPALIQISSEVRQYAFLLLFCAGALYFLDRGLEEVSAGMMLASFGALYLALATHYSSLIFTLTFGLYSLLRIRAVRPRGSIVLTWIAGQIGALTIITALYVTHIAQLRKMNAMEGLVGSYLSRSVLQPQQNSVAFVARANLRLFHYFFSQGAVGAIALALFVAGLAVLVTRKKSSLSPSPRQLAFLLFFPVVVNCILGLFRVYPFGGTRHDAYLAIFAIPAIAFALAAWNPPRSWLRPVAIALVLLLCNVFPSPEGEYIRWRDQDRRLMNQAVAALNSLPPGSAIFTDDQGGLLLSYYLCDNKVVQIEQAAFQPLFKAPCGKLAVISLDPNRWTFKPATFAETLRSVQTTFSLPAGAPLWFFQAGWFIDKEFPLRDELRRFGCAAPRQLGSNILMCQINVP